MASSNWGFTSADWSIDTEVADIPQGSGCLELADAFDHPDDCCILEAAQSGNCREGRLTFYFRPTSAGDAFYILFRAQGTKASPTLNDCYMLKVNCDAGASAADIEIKYRNSGGTESSISDQDGVATIAVDTWYHWRVTWWEGYSDTNDLATVFRVEEYSGGAWNQVGVDCYDTNRRNENSSTNNVGIAKLGDVFYFDEVIVERAS